MKNHELISNANFQAAMENELNKDVYGLANDVVEYILSQYDDNAPFSYDDIENIYIDNSEEIEVIETKIELVENWIAENDENYVDSLKDKKFDEKYIKIQSKLDQLEQEKTDLEDQQDEPQEVMQWFKVSPYLFRQLQANGDVVLESPNSYYYGRCGCGQALYMDYNIVDIYKNHVAIQEVIKIIKDN